MLICAKMQSQKKPRFSKGRQNEKVKAVTTIEEDLDDVNISDDEEGGTRIGDIYIPPPTEPYCSTESKGPRLIIQKIVNNNFKSYAGQIVLGPFHHCFSSIVGPNGSGKSNVIDSLLFVFGYRANKIRCKKISTLLHNSAQFPNMTSCSVAVHFKQIIDREDGSCESVTDSEIVVERTAFRDNSSFYTINKRRVLFKEVASLLKRHHVDLDHNRFLILQGEVESIAMMKAKGQTENECGMLEYLEDIVGTTRYKVPLVKINERVDKLTEERTEKHNRCKLAEREMKDLEQPYNEAVEYLRSENEYTRTQNLCFQKYLSEKKKKLEQYTKEHETATQELKTHDEAYEAVRKEREEKEALLSKDTGELKSLNKKKDNIAKQIEDGNRGFTTVQEMMKSINNQRKENKSQIEKIEKDLIELRNKPSNNQNEIKECEIKVEKLSKQKSDFEEELQKNYAELGAQTKPLIEKSSQLGLELGELKVKVDEAKASLVVSEKELDCLKHAETVETRKFESQRSSYEETENALAEKRSKINELKQLVPQTQNAIAEKKMELVNCQKKEQQLTQKLKSLKSEIQENESKMQTSRSNKVIAFLMRLKNEGKIPGILGRLGDLGAIDGKYDVAISTACGRLDNVLVDTADTAHQCINALKEHDAGRAVFLAMDKLEHWKHRSNRIQTPEQAPRLYDLVRVEDNRVLPAFYFALRNTLVANDLEQATRIAYGASRFRVVTLEGATIEISGTMSGGGRTQIRGKMGTQVKTKTKQGADTSIVTQKALEEMQVQAQELQSQINYCQQTQGQLEKDLKQLHINLNNHETDITKMQISIRSIETQLPNIFKQLEAQRHILKKTTTDAVKVKEMETEISKKKTILQECVKKADKVSKKIQEINSQIEDIHGDKLKSVQTKISSLGTQIKKLKANILKLTSEITASERNIIKMEKQVEGLHHDVIKSQTELTELSLQRQKHEDDINRLANELEEIKNEIEKSKSQFSDIRNEIMLLHKRENESKLLRVEFEQKQQTVAGKMNDVKAQIPHWRDQIKPLRLHSIPGDAEPEPPLKTYTEEELAAHTVLDIQYKLTMQESKLEKKPNLSCIKDYIEKRDVYLERVKVLEDITSKRNEMRLLYDTVRKKRYNEFMLGFHIITRKLKEMYQMITQGGDAELELVDSMDPFTEGVSFSVRPPKKTWKNISNLSGGEKTLSSLALVFALHYYKPSPLYFMDEIDAALDFKNISIVAHYIRERTKNAQFIIISLRSNMFELSDYLIGIYKVHDCTESVTVQNVPPDLTFSQLKAQTQTQPLPSSELIIDDNMEISITQVHETALETPSENVHERENAAERPPESLQGRETTFVPPLESTTFAQQMNLNNADNPEQIIDTNQADVDDASNNEQTTDNIEIIFKKPLPPSQKLGS